MKNLIGFLLIASLLSGCREDYPAVAPTTTVPDAPGAFTTLADFHRRHTPTQRLTLAEDYHMVRLGLNGGATIAIDRSPILVGTTWLSAGRDSLEFTTTALYTPADLVLADQPTNDAAGTKLVSGGLLKIRAWRGGQRVAMSAPAGISLFFPVPASQMGPTASGMNLWNLQTAATQRQWVATGQPAEQTVSTGSRFYTSYFFPDTIGWWHIARPWNERPTAPRTSVRVACATDPDAATATQVWLLPMGVNAAFRAQASRTVFGGETTQELADIPVGTALHVVVLQSRNNTLYYGSKTIAVRPNELVSMTPARLPEADIVRQLRQL